MGHSFFKSPYALDVFYYISCRFPDMWSKPPKEHIASTSFLPSLVVILAILLEDDGSHWKEVLTLKADSLSC